MELIGSIAVDCSSEMVIISDSYVYNDNFFYNILKYMFLI